MSLDPLLLQILACPDTHHAPLDYDEAGQTLTCTECRRVFEIRDGKILGRGASDLTAVALAATLGGRCERYTDVEGVFTADPRIEPNARKLKDITYEEMLELASKGAQIMQARSVEIAFQHQVTATLGVIAALFPQTDAEGAQRLYQGDFTMYGGASLRTQFGGVVRKHACVAEDPELVAVRWQIANRVDQFLGLKRLLQQYGGAKLAGHGKIVRAFQRKA